MVSKGVLSTEAAEKLHHYYGDVGKRREQRTALTIFSILGSLFIGLGIMLLLAHNWYELSRSMRTILSIVSLILAQLLAGWTILNREKSDA